MKQEQLKISSIEEDIHIHGDFFPLCRSLTPGASAACLLLCTKPATPTPTHAKGAFAMSAPKKVVLAYSGGLDTSIILKWLQTEYGCEVVTFTADLGQGEELDPARQKAELLGIKPENI